ncbi:MAG: O-antigen ligase family protein [Deltaproteobacteria bacterium]|nr:O-antigen ligase family protein [Deltaproteobacteria bacterium]
MQKRFIALLGILFTVSHVCGIPLGVNFKIPEIFILVLIFLFFTQNNSTFDKDQRLLLFLLFLALIAVPGISLLFSLNNLAQMQRAAASMGFVNKGGRMDPIVAPIVMFAWSIFSFLSVITFANIKKDNRKIFFRNLLISLFIMNIYSIYGAFVVNLWGGPDIPWFSDSRHGYDNQLRAQGFFIEPLNLAHFLTYTFAFFLLDKDLFTSKLGRFFFQSLNLKLTVFVFILTFSASGVISLAASYFLIFLFFKAFSVRTVLKYIFGVIITIGAAMLYPPSRDAIVNKVIYSIVDPTSVGYSALDRIYKSQAGMNIFNEYPIFGGGLGSSGFLYAFFKPTQGYFSYDHLPFPLNEYVRILAETGLMGLITFSAFAIAYLIYLKKNENFLKPWEILLFAGGFVSTLIDFNFGNFMNVYYVWVFVGFSFVVIRERKKNSQNPILV